MTPKQFIKKIQGQLTPDLLKKQFREENKSNPMYGHCYVASEALFHLLGKEYSDYKPYCGKGESGVNHWWLQNSKGDILDPTADQYYSVGKKPPYEKGRRKAFLTNFPSKRAVILIERVRKIMK